MSSEENKKDKLTLKERLKDKRERAKIELTLYGVFFLIMIVFARFVSSGSEYNDMNNSELISESFVTLIEDNYKYDIIVTIDDKSYYYYGRVLGNNKSINLEVDDEVKSYVFMNNKYYVLDDGNYILTKEEEVYPYIMYRYLDISTIREYIEKTEIEDDTYKVKISDIILNSDSSDYVIINVNEGDKNIVIDYTELFKIEDENVEKITVNITYSDIDNIISLEE